MQVDHAYMSVATLTEEPLDEMDCIENAPSIRAIVIGKGEDFSNVAGMADGSAIMPQVRVKRRQLCSCHGSGSGGDSGGSDSGGGVGVGVGRM